MSDTLPNLAFFTLCIGLILPLQGWSQTHACLIEPYRKIEVRSPVEAIIDTVHVERGAMVRKGQLLVTLDSSVERAALASARFRAAMEGETRLAETRLHYARDKLARREELIRQNFVSAQERDDALAELRMAEAEWLQAKDNSHLALLEQQRLERMLEQRRILAPFDAVVVERLQHPGELAFTGEGAKPVLKLAQIHPLRVEAILPVSLYGSIRVGDTARVEPEPPGKGSYRATVRIVDKVIDSASGTFGVRLDLPNPRGDLPAGLKCRVRFGTD